MPLPKSFGLSKGWPAGGGIARAAQAGSAVVISQLTANRVFQRSTLTGGGQSKGQGTIPLALSAVTSTGVISARCSSGGGTRGDLQAPWQAATVATMGAQTVNITGVDARLGWFYLDILDSSGTWQNGTALVGMGALILTTGQSQSVRQLGKMPNVVGTAASLGVAQPQYSSVYARYTDTERTLATPSWQLPTDGGDYDSTFLPEFLRLTEVAAGVNCAVIGHAVGSTSISQWVQGQQYYNELAAVVDAVGGYEAFYLYIGGNDAVSNTASATFQAGVSSLINGINTRNVARGTTAAKYVCAMANRTTTAAANIANIRRAMKAWAGSNGATYLEPHDIVLKDTVHQDQTGNIRLAHHVYRAMRPQYGLAGDDTGPSVASIVRSTASQSVVITFNLPTGATALVSSGAPAPRFIVTNSGSTTPLALDGTTPITVSGATVTLKLAALPDDTQALDVYVLPSPDPSNGITDIIYDNHTDSDGITHGRQITPNIDPSTCAAPNASAGDTTPDAFTFTDVTGATASTLYVSNTLTVSGIDTPSPISVTGGEYQINGGAWTTASGTISNGNTFAVRATSSASASTAVNVTLTIGGVSDTYTITTAASGSGPVTLVTDSFTGADGAQVVGKTTDTGQTWSLVVGGFVLISNRARASANSSTVVVSGVTTAADCFSQATFHRNTFISAQAQWTLLRVTSTSPTTYYQFGYQGAGASGAGWYIFKSVAGTSSTIGFSAATLVDGQDYVVRGEAAGSTLTLKVDGVAVITITDTSISAGGQVGIRNAGSAPADATGLHLDNFSGGNL